MIYGIFLVVPSIALENIMACRVFRDAFFDSIKPAPQQPSAIFTTGPFDIDTLTPSMVRNDTVWLLHFFIFIF